MKIRMTHCRTLDCHNPTNIKWKQCKCRTMQCKAIKAATQSQCNWFFVQTLDQSSHSYYTQDCHNYINHSWRNRKHLAFDFWHLQHAGEISTNELTFIIEENIKCGWKSYITKEQYYAREHMEEVYWFSVQTSHVLLRHCLTTNCHTCNV